VDQKIGCQINHHPPGKAIDMSANCATWTSERIELLKRCLYARLSCGQIAREIGTGYTPTSSLDHPVGAASSGSGKVTP